MLVPGVLLLPRLLRSQILMKKQPCWAWYSYIISGLPECFFFSDTDSLIEIIGLIPDSPQPDYKWKEQAGTDAGTGSLVQDLHKVELAALPL